MDPSYFGLEDHPFGGSSEREAGYLAETHTSLVTELKAGLKAPHGITLLIGEEGTGKTSLVRRFADDLAEDCTVAYLPTTGPGLRHLLTETIEQLGGSPPPAGDEQALLDCLASLAHARAQHGRTTLVIVDDAHELPAKTIERVGRLFGDDPADPSMLHVVLVGRPELLDRMNAANDRTILKHLVQVCRMDPIGPEESFRYIADRVAKVGGVVDKLFTEDALRMIVKRANGNPGRIHAICTAAMRQAAESGEEAVAADTVDLACIGVEGFPVDGQQSAGGEKGDPMQYIFGEDDVGEGGTQAQRRSRAPVNGTKDHGASEAEPAPILRRAPALMGPVDRVRALLAGVGESRRRLGLWAAGLVAVLVGFAAAMTGTGDSIQRPEQAAEHQRLAAAKGSKTDTGVEAAPLPSTAVRTTRLVVKREGTTTEPAASGPGSPVVGSPAGNEATTAGAPAAAASPPAVQEADRPHVQAPPYAPAPTAASPTPAGDTSLSAAAATAAASTSVATPAAATTPGTKPSVAASAANSASAKQESMAAADKPVELAAAPAPKAASAVVTAKAASVHTPAAQAVPTAGSKYTVQVGAFKSRDNAEALLDQIRKSYPDGRIVITQSGSASVFRVFSGAFASKGDADTRARTLAENGFTTFVRDIPR